MATASNLYPAIIIESKEQIEEIESDRPYFCSSCQQDLTRKAVEEFSSFKKSQFLICPFCLEDVKIIEETWRKTCKQSEVPLNV